MEYVTSRSGSNLLVILRGNLDAAAVAVLHDLSGSIHPNDTVSFRLEAISWVNSTGAGAWCDFLKRIEGSGSSFELVDCSVDFVDYLNLLPTMRGSGTVTSFVVSLVCEGCRAEVKTLVDASGVDSSMPPAFSVCGKCGAKMQPTVPWAEYVGFLTET